MNRTKASIAALSLLSASALTACTTTQGPVDVTRFHRVDAASVNGATFLMVRPADQQGFDGEWVTFASAVAQRLGAQGFVCVADFGSACVDTGGDGPQATHRVTLRLESGPAAARSSGSGASVGVGGSTGSYGSGLGVGVGIDLTRLLSGRAPDRSVRLSVRIDRSTGDAIWEGRAESDVSSRANAGQIADRMATALFADFPGRSGETISVP